MTLKENDFEVLVSVYVLTYNHEKYIEQALNSILNQKTNFRYEVLIGDDGSSDKTQSILSKYQKKYPNKIRLFLGEENFGATKNYFLLTSKCKGKYIAPLEGDDYWIDSNRLQYLVDFLENNNNYIGVSHRREVHDIQGNLLGYDPSKRLLNKAFYLKDFLNGKRFSVMGMVYRNFHKELNIKYKNLIQASRNVADYQISVIMLNQGPVFISDKVFGVYRVRKGDGESNYNSIVNTIENYKIHLKILNEIELFFPDFDLKNEKNRMHFNILYYCLRFSKFDELKHVLSMLSFKDKLLFLKTIPINIIKRLIINSKRFVWKK